MSDRRGYYNSRSRQTNRGRSRKRPRKRKVGTRTINFRILIVFGVIVLFSFVMLGRILWLDRNNGSDYAKRVLSQQSYVSNTLAYQRGTIMDRNGNNLAVSKKTYNMVVDSMAILDEPDSFEPTSEALEDVFGMKESRLQKILDTHKESHYYIDKKYKNLSETLVNKFKDKMDKNKNIKGIWFEEQYKRYYPYSTVGSTVIGFCTDAEQGVYGLESQYNDTLSGVCGKKYGYYDSDLNFIQKVKNSKDGNNLITTIDVNVQGVVEKHMAQFRKDTGYLNMGVIVMNPNNGEIYAMASNSGYNLNDPHDLSGVVSPSKLETLTDKQKTAKLSKIWSNFCIGEGYEPGSTFKPITVAACLDEGVTNPGMTYACNGYQVVGGAKIKCVAFSNGGHGALNICQALEKSCNDALMQLGAGLGAKRFTKYVNIFGFGAKTGIDLPGESTGNVFASDMRSTDLAIASFGQGEAVTMIQMASAFSAVINGGNYYQPHLVKEVQSPAGATIEARDDMLVRKVISSDTSAKLRDYMYSTVENGTANPAAVKGYTVGGKTGTAEKFPRIHKNYVVSFIGCVPTDNPQVVIYTVIDQPHVADQAHSTYATQFSSRVLKDILPLLGVYKTNGKQSNKEVMIPSTKEVPDGGFSDKELKPLKKQQAEDADSEDADYEDSEETEE